MTWTSGKDNIITDTLSCNPIGSVPNVPVCACVFGGSDVINQMLKSAADCTSYQAILTAFQHGQHPSAFVPLSYLVTTIQYTSFILRGLCLLFLDISQPQFSEDFYFCFFKTFLAIKLLYYYVCCLTKMLYHLLPKRSSLEIKLETLP